MLAALVSLVVFGARLEISADGGDPTISFDGGSTPAATRVECTAPATATLACTANITATDFVVAGTDMTVAELLQSYQSVLARLAAVEAFVSANTPPPPSVPPTAPPPVPPASPPPPPDCSSANQHAFHPSTCVCNGGSCANGRYYIDDGTNGIRRYYVDMDGSETGTAYMMRWDTGWASSAWTSSGETCHSGYPSISTDGKIAVSASIGGGYSSSHGGCGVAVTNPLGHIRAKYIHLSDVVPGANCHAGSVDFPAALFALGHNYTAFDLGSSHYIGNYPRGGSSTVTGNLGTPHSATPIAHSHTVPDRSDYRFHLGTRSFSNCNGIEASLKLWFGWDA